MLNTVDACHLLQGLPIDGEAGSQTQNMGRWENHQNIFVTNKTFSDVGAPIGTCNMLIRLTYKTHQFKGIIPHCFLFNLRVRSVQEYSFWVEFYSTQKLYHLMFYCDLI